VKIDKAHNQEDEGSAGAAQPLCRGTKISAASGIERRIDALL
jgi:hypothetical protein